MGGLTRRRWGCLASMVGTPWTCRVQGSVNRTTTMAMFFILSRQTRHLISRHRQARELRRTGFCAARQMTISALTSGASRSRTGVSLRLMPSCLQMAPCGLAKSRTCPALPVDLLLCRRPTGGFSMRRIDRVCSGGRSMAASLPDLPGRIRSWTVILPMSFHIR